MPNLLLLMALSHHVHATRVQVALTWDEISPLLRLWARVWPRASCAAGSRACGSASVVLCSLVPWSKLLGARFGAFGLLGKVGKVALSTKS